MNRLWPVLTQNRIVPSHVIRLRDALYCKERNIGPLTEQARPENLSLREDYRQTQDRYGAYDPERGFPLTEFKSHTAAVTDQGTWLFSHTIQGEKALRGLMQYAAANFFDADKAFERLSLHELPLFDKDLEASADTFPSIERSRKLPLPSPASIPKDMLSFGVCTDRMDMEPEVLNYERLVGPSADWDLWQTPENNDAALLTLLCQNGPAEGPLLDKYLSKSSYTEDFRDLIDNYSTSGDIWDREFIREQTRELAGQFLARDHPGMRMSYPLREYVDEIQQGRPVNMGTDYILPKNRGLSF